MSWYQRRIRRALVFGCLILCAWVVGVVSSALPPAAAQAPLPAPPAQSRVLMERC